MLDLNGHNQALANISADNNAAKIVSKTSANVTLNDTEDRIVHAQIGDKTLGNQINLTIDNTSGKKMIFDGGLNVQNLNVSAGKEVVLQAHATTHAYLKQEVNPEVLKPNPPSTAHTTKPASACDEMATNHHDSYWAHPSTVCAIEMAQKYDQMPDYVDITRPNHIKQPDWDKREYQAQNIKLESGSTLTVTNSTELQGNVTMDNAKLNFGTSLHYIDALDGENTHGKDGFEFQQKVESGEVSTDAIANFGDKQFIGTLTANNNSQISSLIKNFKPQDLNLDNSQLTAEYWESQQNQTAKLNNNSTVKVNNFDLTGGNVNVDASSQLTIGNSFHMAAGTLNAGEQQDKALLFQNTTQYSYTGGDINAKNVKFDGATVAEQLKFNGLTNFNAINNSSAYFAEIDPSKISVSSDTSSNIYVDKLILGENGATMNANTHILKELAISQGLSTQLHNDKSLQLEEGSAVNVTLSQQFVDEVLASGQETQVHITLDNLQDNRVNDTKILNLTNQGTGYYYRYAFENNGITIVKTTADPVNVLDKEFNHNPIYKILKQNADLTNAKAQTVKNRFRVALHNANLDEGKIQLLSVMNDTESDFKQMANAVNRNALMSFSLDDLYFHPSLEDSSAQWQAGTQTKLKTEYFNHKAFIKLVQNISFGDNLELAVGAKWNKDEYGVQALLAYNQEDWQFGWQNQYMRLQDNLGFQSLAERKYQEANYKTMAVDSRAIARYAIFTNQNWALLSQIDAGLTYQKTDSYQTQAFRADESTRLYVGIGAGLRANLNLDHFTLFSALKLRHFIAIGDNTTNIGFHQTDTLAVETDKSRLQWQMAVGGEYEIIDNLRLGLSLEHRREEGFGGSAGFNFMF